MERVRMGEPTVWEFRRRIAPTRRWNLVSQGSNHNPFLGRWSSTFAVGTDDYSQARAASGFPERGRNVITLNDNRKRNDVTHKSTLKIVSKDYWRNQTPRFKPTSDNCKTRQQPTIHLHESDQVYPSANQSLRMSTYGLDLDHLQHIGLRPASSCDTRSHGTPFYMFNSEKMEYAPYINKLKDGDFTLLRVDIFFSPEQQYDYYGRLRWTHCQRHGTPCV